MGVWCNGSTSVLQAEDESSILSLSTEGQLARWRGPVANRLGVQALGIVPSSFRALLVKLVNAVVSETTAREGFRVRVSGGARITPL